MVADVIVLALLVNRFSARRMNEQPLRTTGATWIGVSVKTQKPLSGEELARMLDDAIKANAAAGQQPITVQPVQGAMRPGIVTTGFLVVWGQVPT